MRRTCQPGIYSYGAFMANSTRRQRAIGPVAPPSMASSLQSYLKTAEVAIKWSMLSFRADTLIVQALAVQDIATKVREVFSTTESVAQRIIRPGVAGAGAPLVKPPTGEPKPFYAAFAPLAKRHCNGAQRILLA